MPGVPVGDRRDQRVAGRHCVSICTACSSSIHRDRGEDVRQVIMEADEYKMEHATKDMEQSGRRRKDRNENVASLGEMPAIPACSSRGS